MAERLKIALVGSPISTVPKQKATVKTLGPTRMHKTAEMLDNGAVRGTVATVRHLVKVEEV